MVETRLSKGFIEFYWRLIKVPRPYRPVVLYGSCGLQTWSIPMQMGTMPLGRGRTENEEGTHVVLRYP